MLDTNLNNTIKLSIIIPVYNGLDRNVERCLDSIKSQNVDGIEVICVDDCSTDNSYEWLNEYANNYKKVRVFKTETNVRQGGARNLGIRKSAGDYITFIDQDDYYEDGALRNILNSISKSSVDVLVVDSVYQYKTKKSEQIQLNFKNTDINNLETFVRDNGYVYAPWRLVIRKENYINNSIEFVENVRIEDADWALKVLYHARTIQYQPIKSIHYIKGMEGTTDIIYKDINVMRDQLKAAKRIYELSETLYKDSPLKEDIVSISKDYFVKGLRSMCGSFKTKVKVELLEIIPQNVYSDRLISFAINHKKFYSFISTVTAPFYRIVKTIFK